MDNAGDPDKQHPPGAGPQRPDIRKRLAALTAGPFSVAGAAAAAAQLYDYATGGKTSALGAGVVFVALGVCLAVGVIYLRDRPRATDASTDRRLTQIIVGALALSLLATLAVAVTLILNPPDQSTSAGSGARSSASNAAPSPPATDQNTSPGSVGRASLRAEVPAPGGCSSTHHLSGEVMSLPTPPPALWIVAVLPAGIPNGLKDIQHYPKTRIDSRTGTFALDMSANTKPGTRRGRYLVVAASKEADTELELSLKSDREHDEAIYPDGLRVQLPAGAYEIARTEDLDQTCR